MIRASLFERTTTTLYGSEKDVLRVNYNLRRVIMPRGKSKVLFIFNPLSFRIRAAISLLTFLSIICFFLIERRAKHPRGP